MYKYIIVVLSITEIYIYIIHNTNRMQLTMEKSTIYKIDLNNHLVFRYDMKVDYATRKLLKISPHN